MGERSSKSEKVFTGACVALALVFLVPLSALLQTFCIWLAWTHFEIGAVYFSFLPEVWHAPSFGDWFLIALVILTIRQWIGLTKVNTD